VPGRRKPLNADPLGGLTLQYRAQTWVHPAAKARRSAIQGFGLFAAREFEPGDVISIVGGTVMSEEEFARVVANGPDFNAIQVSEHTHLVEDPRVSVATKGSLNHHCDSNLWMVDAVTVAARAPISAGSELTVDYALFTTSGEWLESPRNCGSPHCRVTPRGTDWRLPEVQLRYRDHFSPFLNARICSLACRPTRACS
jgi:hypothetical protein